MSYRAIRNAVIGAGLFGLAGTLAMAQWSILAPGKRDAKPGNHRYAHLVYANPVPGRETEFNEWYTNMHMGDLVQGPGFIGAQRFRIVTTVKPQPSEAGYTQGYLIIWDQVDPEPDMPKPPNRPSPAWGFNGSPTMSYETLGDRITRPDGKGPTMPHDNKSFRPNRYILMEIENTLPGKDADFNHAADQRVKDVLALPGWMAAQRFVLSAHGGRGQLPKPKYLTIWETEGLSAQAVNTTLLEAVKSGAVKANDCADQASAEIVYWEPISPYITRDDFER